MNKITDVASYIKLHILIEQTDTPLLRQNQAGGQASLSWAFTIEAKNVFCLIARNRGKTSSMTYSNM